MTASINFSAGTVVTSAWLNAIDEDTFENIINVKQYGALGDGSTVDDTAINLAIADLTAGKFLFFPKSSGEYIISTDLTPIPIGAGVISAPGAWIKRSAAAANTVFFEALGNNHFIGLNLDGNAYPTSGGIPGTWLAAPFGLYARTANAVDNVVVDSCHMKNFDFCIFAEDIVGWRITNNLFERTQGSGVQIGASASGITSHNIVANNVFREHGDTACAFWQMASGGEVAYNTIQNNIAKNTQYRTNGYAFDFEAGVSASDMHHNNICNNIVEQVASSSWSQGGITMGDLNEYGVLSGNTLSGNLHSDADVGITISKSLYATVANNTINGFRGTAINADGSSHCLISTNNIRNCGGSTSNYPGIRVTMLYDTNAITVSDNHLSWVDSYAYAGAGSISIGGFVAPGKTVTDIVVKGNTIVNPIDIGIGLYGLSAANYMTDVDVSGNTIIGGGNLFARSPLLLSFVNGGNISNNIVFDTKTGLAATDCNKVRIFGNLIRNSNADTLATFVDITTSTYLNIDHNEFDATVTTPISPAATLTTGANNNNARYNRGVVTENKGVTGLIASGATVTHGLTFTPTNVTISPGDTGVTDFFVNTLGASTFVINYSGGGTHIFYWKAEY